MPEFLSEWTEKNHDKISFGIAGIPAEIQTVLL
jgi:hypothetical protein